ncbi:complex I NDUFA9 subunit family protein [Lysobacter hankyongensis]|uniref:Complex I NDUFA9 subunit family protein n=1 Tax=Lysobacter hankyongensis TaxID=1176535 RepID=A0ABP9C3G5_9GAMM
MSRTVVVLGGSGFVGRTLVARLLAQGHRVRVLTRDAQTRARVPADATLLAGDVFDAAFLHEAFDGADAVINLVGILNERGDDGRGFRKVYVELAEAVIAEMHTAGPRRLLQMSALHAGDGESHYLKARGEAEARVRASTLEWTLFRPSVIAGPGDGLFCRFAQLLRFAPGLPLGGADVRFQPVWVGDVADAFVRALDDDATIGRSYDLVGPEVMTLGGIVKLTARTKGWTRVVLPLPGALGRLQAEVGEHLPGKPISRDNWRSLQRDSTSDDNGLPALGIPPTDVRAKLPEILGVRG